MSCMTDLRTGEPAPFRSKADVLRERGECECGCGRKSNDTANATDGYACERIWKEHTFPAGSAFAATCATNLPELNRRIRANRSTPADPGSAAPAPESDEAWMKRAVFELTGIDATVTVDLSDNDGDLKIEHPGQATKFYAMRKRGRDIKQVRERLTDGGVRAWPVKDSAGMGSESAENPVKCQDAAGPTEPTPAVYCSECAQPMPPRTAFPKLADAIDLCLGCEERRVATARSKWTIRPLPCSPGCMCRYCKHATNEGKATRAQADLRAMVLTGSSDNVAGVAAYNRLKVLESRERRLNAPSPAEAAMLQRGRDTSRWYEVPGDETP